MSFASSSSTAISVLTQDKSLFYNYGLGQRRIDKEWTKSKVTWRPSDVINVSCMKTMEEQNFFLCSRNDSRLGQCLPPSPPPTHPYTVFSCSCVCACMCVSRWDECLRYASMLTDARRQEARHPKKVDHPLRPLCEVSSPFTRDSQRVVLQHPLPSSEQCRLLLHRCSSSTTTTPPTTTMWSLRQVSLTWENRQHSELIYNYITWAAHSAPFLFLPSLIFY